MTEYDSLRGAQQPSGWATGGVVFAATTMLLIGAFQIVAGLAAVLNDEFFVVAGNYAFDIDISAWGWIHLILGVIVALAGFFLFTGSTLAGAVGIVIAMFAAIANFFFIPYYPFWSLVIIALCVWVIWSLTRPGMLE